MKTTFIILGIIFFNLCFSQEDKLKFYGVTLKADEVLPFGIVWGPKVGPNDAGTTDVLNPPLPGQNLTEFLGSIYSTYARQGKPIRFLNLHLSPNIAVLDEINMKWYGDVGIDKVPVAVKSDSKYQEVKTNLQNPQISTADKKAKLVANPDILIALEKSRYDLSNPIKLNVTANLKKGFKFGFSSSIKAQLENIVDGNVDIESKIEKLAENTFTLSNGFYYEIEVDQTYIAIASQFLCESFNNEKTGVASNEPYFGRTMTKFFHGTDQAIITKAAVLQATFTKSSRRQFEANLKLLLKANAKKSIKTNLGAIDEITASISSSIYNSKDIATEVSVDECFYYVRFIRNKDLEIGEGTLKDPCGH